MTLLNQLITETETVNLTEAIEESVRSLQLMKRGGKVATKGAADMFRTNPGLVIGAATIALDAYGKYKRNKRNTIRLFAKDEYEKRMITDIVNAMTKSGRFKVQRIKFEQGGKSWVIKRN